MRRKAQRKMNSLAQGNKINQIIWARDEAYWKAENIRKIIPNSRIFAFITPKPMALKKEAIVARKKQDFHMAASIEYRRLAAILGERGQVSDIVDCLENRRRDCIAARQTDELRLVEDQIKYLPQILHYYKYPGY